MRSVSVSWDMANGRFVGMGGHQGQTIAINAPPAPGEERAPTGFSATELMLASAGACVAWDVVEILRKRRAEVREFEVAVEGEQEPDPPWPYTSVALHFRMRGEGLSVPVMARVIRLSIVRYCSVVATIAGVAAISATVELFSEDGTTSGRQPIELALPAAPIPLGEAPLTEEDDPLDASV